MIKISTNKWRKTVSLIAFVFVFSSTYKAQGPCTWSAVGPDDFNQPSYYAISNPKITIDASGNIYTLYSDAGYGNKATVTKFNGTTWSLVGNAAFSQGAISDNAITTDALGTPYVFYNDMVNSGKGTVMKYNGSAWVNVGLPGVSTGSVFGCSIVFDGTNTPFISYSDASLGYKAVVQKFNGVAWVNVGVAGFSPGLANYVSLAIDLNGIPYVAFEDGVNGGKASVMKYNGSTWINVGTVGFSSGMVANTTMVIDASGNLYVAYSDGGLSGPPEVMKYNGTNWSSIGLGLNPSACYYPVLCIDASGNLYLAYGYLVANSSGILYKYNGTSWSSLGPFGAFGQPACSMAIDPSGLPNIIYKSSANGNKAVVEKYTGTIAVFAKIGDLGISDLESNANAIALDNNGVPYVIFSDAANSYKSTVKKFNGTSWVTVGNAAFTIVGNIFSSSIAFDSNNTPYMVFDYCSASCGPTVLKYNGTAWVNIGSPGMLGISADILSIQFDNNNVPYVSYQETTNGKAVVAKFNGTNWVSVGGLGFSAGAVTLPRMSIDAGGTPYVVYVDHANGSEVTVMKFNGSSWMNVGPVAFSAGMANNTDIDIDATGVPYVVFQDGANGNKTTVMKYNGTAWVYVGLPGFSSGIVNLTRIHIDAGGTPYVAFQEVNNITKKATLMKFDGANWVNVGTPELSAGRADNISLTSDANGNTYLSYSSTGAFVKKFQFPSSATVSANEICKGSTANFNASGGTTYNWAGPNGFSSSAQAPSISNINPTQAGIYTVTITDPVCGPIVKQLSVQVNTTCVWPGDANSDGIADNLDILELGLHFTQTGAPRSNANNLWQSSIANDWIGLITNGKNLKHSDCNGNGIIDQADTLAVYNNYNQTHLFKQHTIINPLLNIIADQSLLLNGQWGTASVYLGDSANTINNINGIAFTISYDHALLEQDSVWLEYHTSFLDPANTNLKFRKNNFSNDVLYTATTHTNNINVSGNGKIATLHYKISSALTATNVLNLSLIQANQSNANGLIMPVSSGTTSVVITNDVGIRENLREDHLSVFPNPTKNILQVRFNNGSKNNSEDLEIINVLGQVVMQNKITQASTIIELSELASGVYYLKSRNSQIIKIIKE